MEHLYDQEDLLLDVKILKLEFVAHEIVDPLVEFFNTELANIHVTCLLANNFKRLRLLVGSIVHVAA